MSKAAVEQAIIRDRGGWWYPSLRELTGANPVPESAMGNLRRNDHAWLEWCVHNGHLSADLNHDAKPT